MWEVGTGGKEKKTGAAECKGGLAPLLSLFGLLGPSPRPSAAQARLRLWCSASGRAGKFVPR
jgi:hypothetical protein